MLETVIKLVFATLTPKGRALYGAFASENPKVTNTVSRNCLTSGCFFYLLFHELCQTISDVIRLINNLTWNTRLCMLLRFRHTSVIRAVGMPFGIHKAVISSLTCLSPFWSGRCRITPCCLQDRSWRCWPRNWILFGLPHRVWAHILYHNGLTARCLYLILLLEIAKIMLVRNYEAQIVVLKNAVW